MRHLYLATHLTCGPASISRVADRAGNACCRRQSHQHRAVGFHQLVLLHWRPCRLLWCCGATSPPRPQEDADAGQHFRLHQVAFNTSTMPAPLLMILSSPPCGALPSRCLASSVRHTSHEQLVVHVLWHDVVDARARTHVRWRRRRRCPDGGRVVHDRDLSCGHPRLRWRVLAGGHRHRHRLCQLPHRAVVRSLRLDGQVAPHLPRPVALLALPVGGAAVLPRVALVPHQKGRIEARPRDA